MDMKYAPDIYRLNIGCRVIKSLLIFKRELRVSDIKALSFF